MSAGDPRRPAQRTPAAASAPQAPGCPFCESDDTELMSLFGSSPLTSQYYCRGCRSAFEQVKWGTLPGPTMKSKGDS
jgi:transposase-like protein